MAESYRMVEKFSNELHKQNDLSHDQKVAIGYLLAAAKEITKCVKGIGGCHSSYLLEKIEKFLSFASDRFNLPDLDPAKFFTILIKAGRLQFGVG